MRTWKHLLVIESHALAHVSLCSRVAREFVQIRFFGQGQIDMSGFKLARGPYPTTANSNHFVPILCSLFFSQTLIYHWNVLLFSSKIPSTTMNDFPIAVQTTHSKRHSFSSGPRPLRLALASTATPGSIGPVISPFTSYSTPSPRSESPGSAGAPRNATRFVRSPGAPRRQSSISYFTPDSETTTARKPTRHGLARSVSVGAKPSLSPVVGGGRSGDRRSTVSVESEKVFTPHTLAEK